MGVNLFFMISGFVIFMTLTNTRHPMDFVVSRFSRLYPAFWVAVGLTFLITHAAGLPGKAVGADVAALNLLMFHSLLGVKHVDSVYWTLEVELLFYAIMLGLWSAGALRRLHAVALAWLGLQLIYLLTARHAGIDLPYTVSRFLILPYVPYFIIGIVIYRSHGNGARFSRMDAAVLAAALCIIFLGEGWQFGLISAVLALLLYSAVNWRPAVLRLRPVLWLGAVSYPLYLVHENIGWAAIINLESRGMSPNLAIVCAIGIAMCAAGLLHRLVEMPAMQAIRTRYRRQVPNTTAIPWRPAVWTVAIGSIFTVMIALSYLLRPPPPDAPTGIGSSGVIRSTSGLQTVACRSDSSSLPLVLLALGQSNAGNQGPPLPGSPVATVFADGRCYRAHDPLPGATGEGSSIWSRLSALIQSTDPSRSVIIAVIGVESTEIAAWTAHGPLRDRLKSTLAALAAADLAPAAVLWQQGEADAQIGTTAEDYVASFTELMEILKAGGINAPVLVAQSTYCRTDGHGVIARAQRRAIAQTPGAFPGPDTDRLRGDRRKDGCHFSQQGLDESSRLWLRALRDRNLVPG
jgi:peptidoglycan/LPS O-acetylase OafA/YrhL